MFSRLIQNNTFGLRSHSWQTLALLLTLVLLAPIAAVFFVASGNSEGLWEHLLDSVIPRYILNTLGLMVGVAIVSLIFGVSAAWVVLFSSGYVFNNFACRVSTGRSKILYL